MGTQDLDLNHLRKAQNQLSLHPGQSTKVEQTLPSDQNPGIFQGDQNHKESGELKVIFVTRVASIEKVFSAMKPVTWFDNREYYREKETILENLRSTIAMYL